MPTEFRPRPQQLKVIESRSRWLGVSSVPGSGKSETIARTGGRILQRGDLGEGQEILLVTFSRSATGNFKRRIRKVLGEAGLITNVGYRVTTLHGLAHQIVRERHEVVGLERNFKVLDDQMASFLLDRVVNLYIEANPRKGIEAYLADDLDANYLNQEIEKKWKKILRRTAGNFIKQVKDLILTPEAVARKLYLYGMPLQLADVCQEIYALYQKELNRDLALDYDDLLMQAYRILDLRPDYLEELQQRWPCILEDEAQDSCRLQEEILRKLAGAKGRWIRVGDPNQAIFESFTTANPQLLLDFLEDADERIDLPVSGRCMPSVINLANYLIDWVRSQSINPSIQDALVLPHITETEPGDAQPNPPDAPERVAFINGSMSPEAEIRTVLNAAEAWLNAHPQETCAILVPANDDGAEYVKNLTNRGLKYRELLKNSSDTASVARVLGMSLLYLDEPTHPKFLERLYTKWKRFEIEGMPPEIKAFFQQISDALAKIEHVEDYLYPFSDASDWLLNFRLNHAGLDERIFKELEDFAAQVRRWLEAKSLSIDQLILTLSQDLFRDAADLATAYQLATLLRHEIQEDESLTLKQLSKKLQEIMEQKRSLAGVGNDDINFTPDNYPGEVVVSTMHKAKGLEWDMVFVTGLNNYDFPFALPSDRYLGQERFVGGLLLSEEALGQLQVAMDTSDCGEVYHTGNSTEQARIKIAKEKVRLLYVAITRAKRGLSLSWNTGPYNRNTASETFVALRNYWGTMYADIQGNSLQPVHA